MTDPKTKSEDDPLIEPDGDPAKDHPRVQTGKGRVIVLAESPRASLLRVGRENGEDLDPSL